MSVLAKFYVDVTVTNETTPVLLLDAEVTAADWPEIDVTVTAAAAVAAAQRYQRLGIRAEYDRGDGTFLPFPDRELGNELTIDESVDAYGDRLTFQLVGERFSPFSGRAFLRSKRAMNFYLTYGSPLNEYLALVFSGFVVEGPFDVHPPSSRVTLLDAAAKYRDRRAKNWSLQPNSRRSRLSIANELLGIGGIPVGTLDLPFGNGGIVRKPSALGDRTILDYLRDMLGALGVEIGFERGLFVGRRYDPTLEPVIDLTPENICLPVNLTSPGTLAPNVTGVVSVSFSRTEPGGLSTVETSVVTTGPYAIMTATGPLAESVRVISEVLTRTSYYGSLDILTEITERGWYAVRAAGEQIQGVVGSPGEWEVVPYDNANYTAYTYPDGSTRREPQEQFRRTRKTIKRKTVDDDRNVVGVREERYFLHFLRRAVWQVVDGDDVLQAGGTSIPLNDEGEGVVLGSEIMGLLEGDSGSRVEGGAFASAFFLQPDELIETAITLNDDGTISEERVATHYYSIGEKTRRTDGRYGYGVENVAYTGRPAEAYVGASDPWGGLKIVMTRYRAIDEDRYEAIKITTDGSKPPTIERATMTGALPRPERADATTSSQEIRATVADSVRVGLAGEEIEAIEHNEFIENGEEARNLALYRARLASADKLNVTIPIEGQVHKWRMVRLTLPGASIDGLKFYVRSVQRNAVTFTEAIVADYYPPHIG